MALSPPHEASRAPLGLQETNQQQESGCALILWTRDRASFMATQIFHAAEAWILPCLLLTPGSTKPTCHVSACGAAEMNEGRLCSSEQSKTISYRDVYSGNVAMFAYHRQRALHSGSLPFSDARHAPFVNLSSTRRRERWTPTSAGEKKKYKLCLRKMIYRHLSLCNKLLAGYQAADHIW